MKGKRRLKRLTRGVLIALAAALASVSLMLGACKKPADKEPEMPPAQETTDCNGNHDFGEWQIVKAATCTEDGEKSRKCKNCDETERQTIAAGHEYKEVKAVAATCHQNGVKAHLHCEKCGDNKLKGVSYTIEELSIASSHRTVQIAEVAATCTEDGVKAHAYCYVCTAKFIGEEEQSDKELAIPMVAHDLKDIAEAANACDADGVKAHKHCVVCGKNFIDGAEKSAEELKIPASHKYGNLIAATEDARAHYECEVCHGCFVKFSEDGEYYEVDKTKLSLLDERWTWVEGKPATCTTDGVKGHYEATNEETWEKEYCSADLYPMNEDEITIAAGHTYVNKSLDEYKHEEVCSRCGERGAEASHRLCGTTETVDGKSYYYQYCTECDYETERTLYVPDTTELYQIKPFIIGKHNINSNYYIGWGSNGRVLMNQAIANADMSAWESVLEEAAQADSYPVTKTVRFSYGIVTKDLEFVFDKYEYTVNPWFPVYQQGQLGALNRVGVKIQSNVWDFNLQRYDVFSAYLSEGAEVTIVDDGGFDVNADLSAGDKKYTVKFTCGSDTETVYEVSFYYTAKRTAGQISSSEELTTVQGRYPEVAVAYSDIYDKPYWETVSLEKFKVVDGTFDCNVLGWQEATFALGDYAEIALRIYVAAPDEIACIYAQRTDSSIVYGNEYYAEKGARGVYVDVEYYSGERGKMLLLPEMLESAYGYDAFDIDKAGKYYVFFNVDGADYGIRVYVYDPENLTATEVNVNDNSAEWLYEEDENGGYTLKYELGKMYLEAKLSDGTSEDVQVTAEMISYDREALKRAIADGETRFAVKITYKGCERETPISIAAGHKAKRISGVFRDGEGASALFVKDGKLYGEYELYVRGENGYYCVPLTAEMLYTAEFDDNGDALTDTFAKFDIKTAAKGLYKNVMISYDGVYERIDLVVFEDGDLRYSLSSHAYSLSAMHIGTKEEVLAAYDGVEFEYSASVEIRGEDYTTSFRLYTKIIGISELTIENIDEIDFSKPGQIVLIFAYGGEKYENRLLLLPNLDLYACEEYAYTGEYEQRYTVRLYENGMYAKEGLYNNIYYGAYTLIDEENGVYGLDGQLLYVAADGKTMKDWTAETFGKKYSVQGEAYVLNGCKLLVYLKDGAGYADEFSDSDYIEDTYTVRAENGVLTIDGVKYAVIERDGVKYLELVIEGNTLYRYENVNEYEEDEFKSKTTVLFNDNGMAYIKYEYCEIPEGGTTYGEWETAYEEYAQWRREGNLLIIETKWDEMTFTLNEDGTVTTDEEFD